MKIGYARVSTSEQNNDLQIQALKQAGCHKIFTDTASGSLDEREGLKEAILFCREGDVLICWKLDRLGRSIKHLIDTVKKLEERKIGFSCLKENINTTDAGGKLVFHIFAALAEFERGLISERTKAGLESARLKGNVGGRPKKLKQADVSYIKSLLSNPNSSVAKVCKIFNVSRATLYRHLSNEQGQNCERL